MPPSSHRPLRCAGGSARSIAYMYQPHGAVAAWPAPREARGSCSSSQALRLLPIWIPGQQTFEIPPLRHPAPLSAASQKSGAAGEQIRRPGVAVIKVESYTVGNAVPGVPSAEGGICRDTAPAVSGHPGTGVPTPFKSTSSSSPSLSASSARVVLCYTLSVHRVVHPPAWSDRRASNPRPPPWEGGALPPELLPHNL